jgi:hypothetical protein
MKKLAIIFLLIIPLIGFSQQGVVKALTVKTLTNTTAATEDFTIAGSYQSLTIQVLCTQLTGTSAGSISLSASVDGTSYKGITDYEGILKGFTNDTLTIANGAIGQWVLNGAPFKYYRLVYAPSGTHTTRVTPKIILK